MNRRPRKTSLFAARLYLAIVGILYLALAIWCSVAPEHTSQKVGFTLNGDSGSSEFITVYGGLEFGMALIFLVPIVRVDLTRFSLISCLVLHGSLVGFRTVSLLIYRDFGAMTGKLAIGEWSIFLVAIVLALALRTVHQQHQGGPSST